MAKKIVGGLMIDFGRLSAVDAVEVEITVAGLIPDVIVKVISAKGATESAQVEAMSGALGSLAASLSRLGPDRVVALMNLVFKSCRIDDEEMKQSRPLDLAMDFGPPISSRAKWEVMLEALRVNLGDFFPAGLSLSSPAVTPA